VWHRANGSPTGTLYKDTIAGLPGEYVEIKTDGTLTECFNSNGELSYLSNPYQVVDNILYTDDFPSNSVVQVSGNTLTIAAVDEPDNTESLWWHYKK
jgi:hypothetical protein